MATKKKHIKKKPREKVNAETGLTDRQEAFARQYLFPYVTDAYPKLQDNDKPFNGVRAAIRAGYSERTARQQASRLLSNVNIIAFMSDIQKPVMAQYDVTADRLTHELATLAFSSIADFIHMDRETGEAWIDITKANDEQLKALKKFRVKELPPVKMYQDGEEVVREVLSSEIEIADKRAAIVDLMKRQGMMAPEKVEVDVKQKIDETDRLELAKSIAFMLRTAGDKKDKKK